MPETAEKKIPAHARRAQSRPRHMTVGANNEQSPPKPVRTPNAAAHPSPSMRLGRLGEELAYNKLLADGYTIIGVNMRISRYEIDIIARDGECLVFIEVKTRSGSRYGTPAQAVTFKKRRSLTEAALRYLQFYNLQQGRECQARFDVIEVAALRRNESGNSGQKYSINHIKNAFDAEYSKQ